MKVSCVGGGPAGLYFALLLKKDHPEHEIVVLERHPDGHENGFALLFWDGLLSQLWEHDPVSAQSLREHTVRYGEEIISLEGQAAVQPRSHGYSVGRPDLVRQLARRATELGVQIRYETRLESPAELQESDLIVAADGSNSMLRNLSSDRFGTSIRMGLNKYVWLSTSKIFPIFLFTLRRSEGGWIWGAGYPTGHKSGTFIIECTPETWRALGYDRQSPEETLASLEKIFAEDLDGHALTAHQHNDRLNWLSFPQVKNEHWYDGNTVLLGDAAHTTHFSIGSGTRLAIEDAIALAGHLGTASSLRSALQAYQDDRKAAVARHQLDARFSAHWLENVSRYADLAPEQFLALWKARRSPLLAHLGPLSYFHLQRAATLPVVRSVRAQLNELARTRFMLRRVGVHDHGHAP